MRPFIPSLLLLFVLLQAAPAFLTTSTSQELEVRGHRTPRDTTQDSIKVVISEGCASQDPSDVGPGGREIDLAPGSPLVLTHKIKLVPSGPGSGSGSCGCEADLAALRERLERLEREVSALREKCGGAEGGCCTSKESKGAGCSIKPGIDACPNECSDQGRCVDGKCVCFPGFSGPDCGESDCPGNCNDRGRCVNGRCVCDPGFTGLDCSQGGCPDNCSGRGRCVDGKCVCDGGFTGPSCSDRACPGNCNSRGRCVDGRCVCNPGFTGPACQKKTCPDNCNDRGRCVNGKCVCDGGFTGPSCSEASCPGNCNSRGRCVDGRCVCNPGFTGPDCSQRACPDNCNDRGRCVNGKCVCDSGFMGDDCSEASCPGNCNNRGRCVDGECQCEEGFGGPDCLEKLCPNDCYDRGRCVDGKCVCDSGFTGDDCSEASCPGNCNGRGRCVKGQCECDEGFTGDDCSQSSCPGHCNHRGLCVNGQCVCDAGFTGDDCSEKACPGNCNGRGRCADGQCVCADAFTGADCSEKSCPNDCSNRGKCVNGKCVCEAGFAGPDCAAKGCPNNCSNKGRCVKGRCVCRRGFTGPDCSQCEEGRTGANCDTLLSAVSQLTTRNVTDTSVTLVWTPPPVRYETYYITFTSQKESDQQITVQVEGSLTSFTQMGLAAGQEYTVSISGEIDGRRGAESATEFTTLISGPTNLQVVKTTSTSAVVQWEHSQGEIDRYLLTVTPNDGAGRRREMTIAAGQNSAHIQQLEAGRLYDITLVAEKSTSRSKPAAAQVTPGKTFPRVSTAALTSRVTVAPGQGEEDRDEEVQVSDQHGQKEDRSEADLVKVGGIDGLKDSTASVTARTKPLVSGKMAVDGTSPKLAERPTLSRKPNVPGLLRFNRTRVVPGGRKVGSGPFKKKPAGEKMKPPIAPKKPKPGVPIVIGNKTKASTWSDPNVEATGYRGGQQGRDAKNPTLTSGTDSETDRQSSSEEPTTAVGTKEQPDVGMSGPGTDSAPVSSEPSKTAPSQEKKCLNKVKVTHIRLPHKDRGNGCRGDGTVPVGGQGPSETDDTPDSQPSSAESNLDYSPDPLNKLLTDTFVNLNITTFSVHLSEPEDLSADSDRVKMQILTGLRPLASSSSSSSTSSTSQTSVSSSAPSSSPSFISLVSSSSTATPSSSSLTHLISSSPSSLPSSSPPPSSPSSSDELVLVQSNEPNVDNTKITTRVKIPEDVKQSPSEKGGLTVFRRTSPKSGYVRRPRPNVGLFRNKTHLTIRAPDHSPPHLTLTSERDTDTRHTSTGELLSSPSTYSSEESSSQEVNVPLRDASGDKDEAATSAPSGAKQNEKKMPAERRRIPVRRLPPNGGFLRRPFQNFGPLQNRTRPNLRQLPPPSQPQNPTSQEQVSSTGLPATPSPPVSKEPHPAEGTGPVGEQTEDKAVASVSGEFDQSPREAPSSNQPNTKAGYFRRQQLYGGRLQNKTRINLRPPHIPHRGPMRKLPPTRKVDGGSDITVGGQSIQLEKVSTPEISDNQSPEEGTPTPTQGVQSRQSGEHDTTEVISSSQVEGQDTTIRPQTNKLEEEDIAPVQTAKSGEDETRALTSDINEEKESADEDTGTTGGGRPTVKQPSSVSRHGAPRPVTLPKRKAPAKGNQIRHYTSGSQRKEDAQKNKTVERLFVDKTEPTRSADSKPLAGSDVSSAGVQREPLDYVGVTNQTLDGFTLTWDAPEGKYKNFVVTSREVVKNEATQKRKKEGTKENEGERDVSERAEEANPQPTKGTGPGNGGSEDENRVPEDVVTQLPGIPSSTASKPATGSDKTFKKVVPGSARSFQFENLPPQTEYTVTLLGKGPGLLSRLHKLVISTGPEPPTDIVFSEVTDNSLTVSWTKPRTPVSGFKVTYTHKEEGEPVSVSMDSGDSTLGLSRLSPGSSYEVSVISILGLDESDPIRDFVTTLPDPPTDLRAVNVTDTKALLLWRPALAAIDKYAIVYGSGTESELRVTVSGNAAEHQLSGLQGSTTYTVTISSQLGSRQSSAASTTFTTTGGSARDVPRDLQARNVTPRTALLSWKPPSNPAGSYRLTYQTEGVEVKEVVVSGAVTEYNLTRLHPGSKYTVQLQAEGGRSGAAISTEFTTGSLRFPFPTDCSQELLNGIRTSGEVEIFPKGKHGTPMMVYCDMETDGGGWTVFQRRKDGSVDFFKGWKDYTKGFGDLNGEFWLGLDSIHNLTAMTPMSLRIDLRDKDESVFAKYSTFDVAKRNYRLTVGGYSGTAGDSLSYHNNRAFSTKDRDPAPFITRCAMSYRGGWWYKNCHEANLNGLYGIDVKHQGVIWKTWKGKEFSIAFTEMKMRPTAFRG